jgi:hypothetical protein
MANLKLKEFHDPHKSVDVFLKKIMTVIISFGSFTYNKVMNLMAFSFFHAC